MTKKIAVVFPGQGSQSLGMLADLAAEFPVVGKTFEEASSVLGYDLWDVVQNQEEKLNSTVYTQPVMLAAGVAVWRVWQEKGLPQPEVLAGHSLGEYTALVAAGVIAFEDAISLVALRAKYMQEAVPEGEGAMAAVLGLDNDAIQKVCRVAQEGGVVEAVNFNAPGQIVIAGEKEAVEKATAVAKAEGAKRALMLPVSVPSHSSLMKPAAEKLAEKLNGVTFNAAAIPVIQNTQAKAFQSIEEVREALLAQLYSPVLWVDSVNTMDVDAYVELGPGKVLAGLVKRIQKGAAVSCVDSPAALTKTEELIHGE